MSSLIDNYIAKVSPRLANLSPEETARVSENATFTFADLVEAQKAQSSLFAAGKIPQDVAQWMYSRAGGEVPNPDTFVKLPLAERVTFTKVFLELLDMKIKLLMGR